LLLLVEQRLNAVFAVFDWLDEGGGLGADFADFFGDLITGVESGCVE
jgi:hypothetical protein